MALSLLSDSSGVSTCSIANLLHIPLDLPQAPVDKDIHEAGCPCLRKRGVGAERTSASLPDHSKKQMTEKCVTKLCPGKFRMLGGK